MSSNVWNMLITAILVKSKFLEVKSNRQDE